MKFQSCVNKIFPPVNSKYSKFTTIDFIINIICIIHFTFSAYTVSPSSSVFTTFTVLHLQFTSFDTEVVFIGGCWVKIFFNLKMVGEMFLLSPVELGRYFG